MQHPGLAKKTPSRASIASKRFERAARACGSGFLFLVFGIGAVILAALLFPASRLLATPNRPADAIAQRGIARAFALFIWLGQLIHIWQVETTGFERFREPGTLIVANHPTLIDVVLLLSMLPYSDCVVKRAAWRNPALWGIVRAAGYIPNDDGADMVDACVARLQAGRTVLLFPEGSRSPDEGLRTFKRGAAHVIVRSGRPVVPVFIECRPPALKKGQPWYALPNDTMRFTLEVGDAVDFSSVIDPAQPISTSARRVNAHLLEVFESALALHRESDTDRDLSLDPGCEPDLEKT